jgi:hypothetical protein
MNNYLCTYVRVMYVILPKFFFLDFSPILASTRENGIPHFLHTRGTVLLGNWGTYLSFLRGISATKVALRGCDLFQFILPFI